MPQRLSNKLLHTAVPLRRHQSQAAFEIGAWGAVVGVLPSRLVRNCGRAARLARASDLVEQHEAFAGHRPRPHRDQKVARPRPAVHPRLLAQGLSGDGFVAIDDLRGFRILQDGST